jgi:hypothetical protein
MSIAFDRVLGWLVGTHYQMNDLAACELQLVDGPSGVSSGDIRDDPPAVELAALSAAHRTV